MKKISRVLCVMVAIGVVVGPQLLTVPAYASTPFSGSNGKIAFTKTSAKTTNIWTMRPGGGHEKALTRSGAFSPVWSPNGRKMVFVNAEQHLQTMRADGSGLRNLTLGRFGAESSPVWSYDGSRVAFVRQITSSNGQELSAIFTIKADGTSERNVSGWAFNKGYRAPSWAPDGKRLVYEHFSDSQSRLVIAHLATGHVRELTSLSDVTESSNVSWSPSGKKILFRDSNNETYTIWPDGSHRTVISDGDSYTASWSPSGKQIAFLEDSDGEDISISEENGDVTVVPLEAGPYQEIGAPSWSPDGTKLVFTRSYTAADKRVSDIYSLNIRSGMLKKLAPGDGSELNWQAVS